MSSAAASRPLRRVRMLTTGRWHPPVDARLMPTVIAVGAATPGIGKSVVVSNLATSIAGMGRRVVVVDLDFRAPRQHTLFGVKSPEGGLQAWLERKRDRRDEPPQQTRVRNLRLLPGPVPASDPISPADTGPARPAAGADPGAHRPRQRRDRRGPRRGQSPGPVRLLRHERGPPGGHVARAARAAGDVRVPEERGPSRRTQARRRRARRARALLGRPRRQFDRRARPGGDLPRVLAPGPRAPRDPVARGRLSEEQRAHRPVGRGAAAADRPPGHRRQRAPVRSHGRTDHERRSSWARAPARWTATRSTSP